MPLPPPARMQAQASSLRPGDNAGLPSTDPKAPAIILSNWWCGIIGLAGASVYYVLYDQVGTRRPRAGAVSPLPLADAFCRCQTDKVKTVLEGEGLLLNEVPPAGAAAALSAMREAEAEGVPLRLTLAEAASQARPIPHPPPRNHHHHDCARAWAHGLCRRAC